MQPAQGTKLAVGNVLEELQKLGQSIWLDYIRRNLISSGELKRLVEAGLRGVTSNPTIFEKAIAGSTDYDEALRKTLNAAPSLDTTRSEEHTSELQSPYDLVCRLLLEKKKK